MSETNSTLYICYFGLLEPLVQTQVVPYLKEIAKDTRVHLLTFEPAARTTRESLETEKRMLARGGIEWHSLTYHSRPSAIATAYDILRGSLFILNLVRKNKIGILHARAHIPLAMALLVRKVRRVKIIFDIRGLMAEEYVDSGIWLEHSTPFRMIKKIERWGLRFADEIVVLTEKFRDYLVENGLRDANNITVIPCCVDYSRLEALGPEKQARFELIYAGSVTGLYMLEEMGRLFVELKTIRSDSFFSVLTAGNPDYVRAAFNKIGISPDDFSVQKVEPADVLDRVRRSQVAISFRKPTFSQIAASPTKIGEYLACGIPVIVNSGIGDIADQVNEDGTGVVIDKFEQSEYAKAIDIILDMIKQPDLADECIAVAKKRFDLSTVGGPAYRRLYKRLLDSK